MLSELLSVDRAKINSVLYGTTRHWVCVYTYVLQRALCNSGPRTAELTASLVTMRERCLLYGKQSVDEVCSLYNVPHSL